MSILVSYFLVVYDKFALVLWFFQQEKLTNVKLCFLSLAIPGLITPTLPERGEQGLDTGQSYGVMAVDKVSRFWVSGMWVRRIYTAAAGENLCKLQIAKSSQDENV